VRPGLDGVVVVTGAAQGVGEGIASRLAREGSRVVVADRNLEAATTTAARIDAAGGRARAVHVDVTDPQSVARLGSAASEAFGEPVRLFVANAGVQTFQRATDLSVEEWDLVLEVNARGTMLCLQEAARCMPDGTAVVAVASIQGRLGAPFYPHYAASKAAVISLVKSFALALAPRRIRVNSVAPGIIETALWDQADARLSALTGREPGAARAERIAAVPLGRAGTVADVAGAVAFLLSDDASYITGECLHVCGGDVML
jgi:NAD(P)-dependent dehydrogenase (short-subunit alcohol dehydrogenase family)